MRPAADSTSVRMFDKTALVMRPDFVEQSTVDDAIANRRGGNQPGFRVMDDPQPPRFRVIAIGNQYAVQGAEVTVGVDIERRHARLAAFPTPARLIGAPQCWQAAQAGKAARRDRAHRGPEAWYTYQRQKR